MQLFFLQLWRLKWRLHIPQMGDVVECRLPLQYLLTFYSIPVTEMTHSNSTKVAPARKTFQYLRRTRRLDASPCPATGSYPCNSWRRVVESDRRSKELSRINRKNQPARQKWAMVPRAGLDMATPIGQTSGTTCGHYGRTRVPLRAAPPATPPAVYAATAGAAAIAALIAEDAPLVAS